MTTEHQASRTLVKSPPELWAECSDSGSLARHIGEFGEIRITRLEPETSVSWEAEHVSGTVEIEPSGWGTRVTLTARTTVSEVVLEAADVDVPVVDVAVVDIAGVGPAGVETAGVDPEEEADRTPEPNAGVVQEALDRPVTKSDSVEEESDAKVEATVAQSDPAVAGGPIRAGGRWRRLIARSRAWFGTPGQASQATADPPDARPEEAGEPETVTPDGEPAVQELPLPGPADEAELAAEAGPAAGAEGGAAPEPAVPPEPAAEAGSGAEAEPAVGDEPAVPPEPCDAAEGSDGAAGPPSLDPEAVLMAALDSLGQAHHRPFSRA